MSSYVKLLKDRELIHPPKWLAKNVMFEGLTGSVAYGVSTDTSDMDIVGFAMPPKEVMFPHLRGEIMGFGTPGERFEQFQEHHIDVPDMGKQFDITIYSIVKFFQLCMENNPNMVDVLFLPRRCVLHSTAIYEHIRDNRRLFLHKGSWHKFRGYSYSQLSKIKNKTNSSNPRRAETIEKHGYDTKFAYHVVRLFLEVEQILEHGDLTLDNNVAILRSIREGEWSLDKLIQWAADKERDLESFYHKSSLPHRPDEGAIKDILIECIEMHYGSISQTLAIDVGVDTVIADLETLIAKYK